jgi:DNA topoisomerase-1
MKNYTLMITEKPSAAQRIAQALDVQQKPVRMQDKRVPYYIARRNGEIVIVPALGHLYTIAAEQKGGSHYPVFAFKWVPRHMAEKRADHVRAWLETISKLAKDAITFVDACDYDIEGSLIGYNILKHACKDKDQEAKRMKYSTLTREELEKAYDEPMPHLDFALIEAGQTRHEVDWLYGINLTRALTTSANKTSKQYSTLSTGRVQGPTLRFLAAREKAIQTFVPTPYWKIKAQIEIDRQTFDAEYKKSPIETKKEADAILASCRGKDGLVRRIATKQLWQSPPLPFDLGTLQSEAYSLFGYTPKRTANMAQHLYLDAMISYPRTSSQKLPPTIDYRTILKGLNKIPQYRQLTAELLAKPELKPNEGKKEDPAHPAIYPTGNQAERTLDNPGKNILDLINRRFMSVFAEPALIESIRVHININSNPFLLTGRRVLEAGWLRFYTPYARITEIALPLLKESQMIHVKKVLSEGRFTRPPSRHNPRSLLRKMEQHEIGTKATRADIMQTLYDRNYIRGENIIVTDLGFEVLEVLERYCPTVVSVNMTRELEHKMNRIQEASERREGVLEEAVDILKSALDKIRENETTIGKQLSNAVEKAGIEERTVAACPTCKTGKLVILHSRKTGKRFVGCTNYFKGICKTSFPLPQRGTIRVPKRSCSRCSWPTVQIITKGRPSWTICLNPKCPSKNTRRNESAVQDMR